MVPNEEKQQQAEKAFIARNRGGSSAERVVSASCQRVGKLSGFSSRPKTAAVKGTGQRRGFTSFGDAPANYISETLKFTANVKLPPPNSPIQTPPRLTPARAGLIRLAGSKPPHFKA